MDAALIVFTRYPEPGRTKTRLIGALGPEGAARLHRDLTDHTLAVARRAAAATGARLEVHHTGHPAAVQRWLGDDPIYRSQTAGDLGTRMAAAFATAAGPAVLVGTDCPDLTPEVLARALGELERHDIVLGPATDGGYYLVGLRAPRPALFAGIAWGTDRVLVQTLQIARDLDLRVALLESLPDIDRPEDLDRLPSHLQRPQTRERG